MFNNLDSSIASISEDQLNELFGDTPASTVNANTLIGAKTTPEKTKEEDKAPNNNQNDDLGLIEKVEDIDSLLDDEEVEKGKDKEEEEDKKEKSPKKADTKAKTKEDKKVEDDKNEDADTDDTDTEEDVAVKEVLKSTVDFLIDKGLWLDFEGREDLEIDAKTYAELTAKQDEVRISQRFNELVDSTGAYGKAIINFVKNGGNPDEVIDLFKEQKQIESFDINTEDGKKSTISKYYKDILNWKPERIERHIAGLIAKEELETEATEVHELYEQHTQEQLEKINKEQEVYLQQQKQKEAIFEENISTTIKSRKDLTEREKKFLEQSILQRKHKLPTGQTVSDFYVKFAEMQADPQQYVDFVNFVMNKENYLNKIKKDITNQAVDKTFNFVKGNTAVSNKKGSSHDNVKRQEKAIADFDFGLGRR